jgi:hypothetical protein
VLSSISNFKTGETRKGRLAAVLMAFCLMFAGWVALGLRVHDRWPQWSYRDSLPGDAWSPDKALVAETAEPLFTNYIFYHGIGPAISSARGADVLFLGDSRPMFAFRDGTIQEARRRSGMSFFNMAGPSNDCLFSTEILEKQRLAPPFVVVNEDGFFNPVLWPPDKDALTKTYWQCWVKIYQHYYSWKIRRWVQRWVPKLGYFKEPGEKNYFMLRSVQTGGIFSDSIPPQHFRMTPFKEKFDLNPGYLARAEEFKQEMDKQGTRLVIIRVPFQKGPDIALAVARRLKVPCVEPWPEGLETFDGIHLTPDSADRFAEAFFKEFFRLPEVIEWRKSHPREVGEKF